MIKQQIIHYLEENYGDRWEFSGKLARELHNLLLTKESVIERRMRELNVSGVLDKQLVSVEGVRNKVVKYRMAKVELPEPYADTPQSLGI